MRASGLISLVVLASFLSACSESTPEASQPVADAGCNLFTGVGCEDARDTSEDDAVPEDGTRDASDDTAADVRSDISFDDLGVPDGVLPDVTTDEAKSLRDYCKLIMSRVCFSIYQCGDLAAGIRPSMEEQGQFSDEVTCREAIGTLINPYCADYLIPLEQGRYTLDQGAAATCVGRVANATCSAFFPGDADLLDCTTRPPLAPKVESGGDCNRSDQCIDGAERCSNTRLGGNLAQDGRCEPASGEACDVAANCGMGQFCDQPGFDGAVFVDIEGACQPRVALGEGCEEDAQCPAGARCDFSGHIDPATGAPTAGTCTN